MSLNKVITSVNALANSVVIPNDKLNNVVCIDTVNNRIGVKTANPEKEIDISGMLKTNLIYLNNENNLDNIFDISYDKSFISFSEGIKCKNIDCSFIDISTVINDVLFLSDVDISSDLYVDLSLVVNGTIEGQHVKANGMLISSDDRYKHNERKINNGLEIIRQLEPQIYDKTFKFKKENYRGQINEDYNLEAGLIAQDVYKINDLSFTVKLGNINNPYYLDYNNIFVYALAGIKDLDKIVTNKISDISNRLINIEENILNNIEKINYIEKTAIDISNMNINNIRNLIRNQNTIIQSLNSKINILENKINNLEK